MHYSYHNRIKQRIRNGELIGAERAEKDGYAVVLIFNTPPFTRPVKNCSVWRYEDELKKFGFEIDDRKT